MCILLILQTVFNMCFNFLSKGKEYCNFHILTFIHVPKQKNVFINSTREPGKKSLNIYTVRVFDNNAIN